MKEVYVLSKLQTAAPRDYAAGGNVSFNAVLKLIDSNCHVYTDNEEGYARIRGALLLSGKCTEVFLVPRGKVFHALVGKVTFILCFEHSLNTSIGNRAFSFKD